MKKYLNLTIILLLSFIIFTINVHAESVVVGEGKDLDYGIKGSGSMRGFYNYSVTSDGETTNLYCRDAGLHMSAGTRDANVVTLDPSNPHDAGIIFIVNNERTSLYTADSRDNVIRTIAIRIYDYIFGMVNTNITRYSREQTNCKGDERTCEADCGGGTTCTVVKHGDYYYEEGPYYNLRDNVNLAIRYVNESSEIRSLISSIPGASNPDAKYGSWASSSTTAQICNPLNGSGCQGADNVQQEITELLVGALKKAKDAAEGKADSGSNSFAQEFEKDSSKVDEGTNYKQLDTYSYVAKNYDVSKDTKDKILIKFNCPMCSTLGIKYTVMISSTSKSESYRSDNSNEVSQLIAGIDLIEKEFLKETEEGSGICEEEHITIRISFTVAKDNYECGNKIPYNLNIKYTGGNSGAKMYTFSCDEDAGEVCTWQIMYGVEAIDESTDSGYTPGDGDDTEKELHELDENGIIDFCDSDDDDKKCSTYITPVSCSLANPNDASVQELIIREGVEVSSTNIPCTNTDSKVNVDKCVIDGKDILNNDLNRNEMDSDDDPGSTIDFTENSFCKVACIENFHINLPQAQNENAGRYFSLSATLNGGQQCYTGNINVGSINALDHGTYLNTNIGDAKYSDTGLKIADSFAYKYEEARELYLEAFKMYTFYFGISSQNPDGLNIWRGTKEDLEPIKLDHDGHDLCGGDEECEKNCQGPQCYDSDFHEVSYYDKFGFTFINYDSSFNKHDLLHPTDMLYVKGLGIGIGEKPKIGYLPGIVQHEHDVAYKWECGTTTPVNIPVFDVNGNPTTEQVQRVTCDILIQRIPYSKPKLGDGYKSSTKSHTLKWDRYYRVPDVLEKILKDISVDNPIFDPLYKSEYTIDGKKRKYCKDYNCADYNVEIAKRVMADARTRMEEYIKQLNDCSGWNLGNYEIDPIFDFDYEEGYIGESDRVKTTLEAHKASDSQEQYSEDKLYCKSGFTYNDEGKPIGCAGGFTTRLNSNKPKELCKVTTTGEVQQSYAAMKGETANSQQDLCTTYKELLDKKVTCDEDDVDCTSPYSEEEYNKLCNSTSSSNDEQGFTTISCQYYDNYILASVYESKTAEITYTTPTQFRTLLPSGIIVAPSEDIDDSIELPEAWPLEFSGKGVYTYKLYVQNLGQYDPKHPTYPGKYGRIWDSYNPNGSTNVYDSEVVPNVVTKASQQGCTGDSIHKPEGSTANTNGEYVCSYFVDCITCSSSCDPDKGICYDPNCPTGSCPSSCDPNKGPCAFKGELNVSSIPFQPGEVNPNDRDLGPNWSWDENIETYLELKAYVTTKDIENNGNGEDVFDVQFNDTIGGGSYDSTSLLDNNYAIEIDLSRDVINWIKNYNNGKTYADNTLSCYSYTTESNETYDGMFCYSTFIDKLISEFNTSDEVKVHINGNRPLTADERESFVHSNQAQPWWTTWDQAVGSTGIANRWITSGSISIDKSLLTIGSYKEAGIGPMWK